MARIKLLHVAKLTPNTHKCIEHAKCIETENLYIQAKLQVKINQNYSQVSKYYIKKLSSPTNILVFLDPCPFSSIYILMAVMFPRGFWYKISLR